jgi:hypothetical protein
MPLRLVLLTIVLLPDFALPTEAHDIYSHLKDRWGNSCCAETDCRPAQYRLTPSGVKMFVDGTWLDVPDSRIQYQALLGDRGESGGGHWCGRAHRDREGRVFHVIQCAILPPSSTSASDTHQE